MKKGSSRPPWFIRRSIFSTDAGGNHLTNKFELPLPFGILCWVWLKMVPWFWNRFLNTVNIPLLMSPFQEKWNSFQEKSIYTRMFGAKFGWNWPSVCGNEIKHVKSLQADGRTDRLKTNDQKISGTLSIKNRALQIQTICKAGWSRWHC